MSWLADAATRQQRLEANPTRTVQKSIKHRHPIKHRVATRAEGLEDAGPRPVTFAIVAAWLSAARTAGGGGAFGGAFLLLPAAINPVAAVINAVVVFIRPGLH